MKLTQVEARSAVWQKLRSHLIERLDEHRRKNDTELDPIQTARLRGRCAEIKALLELDAPDAPHQEDTNSLV